MIKIHFGARDAITYIGDTILHNIAANNITDIGSTAFQQKQMLPPQFLSFANIKYYLFIG